MFHLLKQVLGRFQLKILSLQIVYIKVFMNKQVNIFTQEKKTNKKNCMPFSRCKYGLDTGTDPVC